MKLRTKARLAKLEAALPPLRDEAADEKMRQLCDLCKVLWFEERATGQVASFRKPGHEMTPLEEEAEAIYLKIRDEI